MGKCPSGRRIVDIYYIFEQIKTCVHEGGFGCSFMNMVFVSEKHYGLRSTFKFICSMCNISSIIMSEEKTPDTYIPVNLAAISGSIAVGIGYSQLEEMLASIDIPCMSDKTFQSGQNQISESIHHVAEEEMRIAGEEERKLAIESGEIDIDGIPMCAVVADGQWSKRSYKTKYDALSGVVSYNFIISLMIYLH